MTITAPHSPEEMSRIVRSISGNVPDLTVRSVVGLVASNELAP